MDLKLLRQDLHMHPQVSGHEQYSHDQVVALLQSMSPTGIWTRVNGWGVVALWHVGAPVTIAFRADTDALSIGHRCGHDGHTAILMGVAQWVDSHVGQLRKNIMLIWQPEEETGCGAQKIVDSGLLQQYDVSAIFALHNLPGFKSGSVVLNRHTFAAASVGVTYRFNGRPTHASTPEMGLSPGLAVADAIRAFDAFNTGESHPAHFRQATLIHIEVGQPAFGTAAADASISFTLRAYTNSAMQTFRQEADNLMAQLADRYGLSISMSQCDPFMATENTPHIVDDVCRVAMSNDFDVIMADRPFRWSEDFASYLAVCPGCLMGIGSGEFHPELHHPDYDFPDDVIPRAVALFVAIAEM